MNAQTFTRRSVTPKHKRRSFVRGIILTTAVLVGSGVMLSLAGCAPAPTDQQRADYAAVVQFHEQQRAQAKHEWTVRQQMHEHKVKQAELEYKLKRQAWENEQQNLVPTPPVSPVPNHYNEGH